MENYTLVSGNQFKIQQWLKVIPNLKTSNHNLPEIQGKPKEIVFEKCLEAFKILKTPVIVEDVSLYLHRFSNFPGPYIKWFHKDLNTILTNTPEQADFVHLIAGYDGNKFTFNSQIETVFIKKEQESNSFSGFEHQIIPFCSSKTFKEIYQTDYTLYEKISPRIQNIKYIKGILGL